MAGVTAAITAAIATNFAGFSRELLLGSFAKHSAFAGFLAATYILILGARKREMAAMAVMLAAAGIARHVGILRPWAVGLTVWSICVIVVLPFSDRDSQYWNYGISRLHFIVFGSLLLPAASTLALIGQQLTITQSHTFDIPSYLVDHSYGFSAAAAMGNVVWAHPGLHQSLKIVYGWLPAAVAACYALNVRAGNPDADVLLKAALASGAIAFFLYHLFPAAGPAYAFGRAFPGALPDPATLVAAPATLAVPGAPRNCMPSVHLAWVILAAAESRSLGRVWRAIFMLFAALTACATLALGEHYLIDLVVAVPFTLSMHALFARRRAWLIGWRATVLAGGLATLGWLLFLRAWTPPLHVSPLLWLITIVTLAGSTALRFAPGGQLARFAVRCAACLVAAPDRPAGDAALLSEPNAAGNGAQTSARQTANTVLPNL
ncbi:MAG: phosphatase PAP2 family protein [Stellaceae bacterium]